MQALFFCFLRPTVDSSVLIFSLGPWPLLFLPCALGLTGWSGTCFVSALQVDEPQSLPFVSSYPSRKGEAIAWPTPENQLSTVLPCLH